MRLYQSYLDHELPGRHQAAARKPPGAAELADVKFQRFVEAMQAWDRAMAERIAGQTRRDHSPLVVAIMGSGHLRDGHGVPLQLRDLGVTRIAVALPWDSADTCTELTPGVADAVFGVETRPQPVRPDRPRLGISIEPAPTGVLVREVVVGSIAEQAGIRAGDVIVRIAGEAAVQLGEVIEAVQRQAPGTWLPITVKRGDETLDLVARFPPRK
jgi:membrane-associated protease RseP (regulator of RpoE activity)